MAGYDLGTARGVIKIGYDPAGISQAEKGLDSVSKKSGSTSRNFSKGAKVMALGGIGIAAGIGLAIKTAANFEEQISGISAVSGATGPQLDALRNKALQLGKDTKFSASDAASAIEELVKAGISVPDVLNGAADAATNLAAAGGIGIPEAATLASNAMNQFKLTSKELPAVVDSIAGAANASAIDVGQFGTSLAQVGAVAHLTGINFDDTATAIAELGNAGIIGSDAGTSLKTFLLNLSPSTNTATAAMEKLGLISQNTTKQLDFLAAKGITPVDRSAKGIQKALLAYVASTNGVKVGSKEAAKDLKALEQAQGLVTNKFFDANGKTKKLADIQQVLKNSLKGLTKEQQTNALKTIFGSDAIRAAAVLADNGAAGYNKLSKAIHSTSAADVAKTRMNNLKGSIEQLKGSLETAEIQLGQRFLPRIKQLVDFITGLINKFIALNPQQQQMILAAIAAAGAFLLFGAAVIKTVQFMQNLSRALKVIGQLKLIAPILRVIRAATLATSGAFKALTLSLLTNPIFLVIAALIALGVGLYELYKHNKTFRDFINSVWASIKQIVLTTVDALIAAFHATVNWLVSTWNTIKSAAVSIWNPIWKVITTAVQVAMAIIKGYIAVWKFLINIYIIAPVKALMAFWQAFWRTFGGVILSAFNLIKAILKLEFVIVRGIFILYFRAIKLIVLAAFNAIKAIVSAVWGPIKAVISAGLNAAKAIFSAIWSAIRAVVVAAFRVMKSVVQADINLIKGIVRSGVAAVKLIFQGLSVLGKIVGGFFQKIYDAIQGPINSVLRAVGSIGGRILNALGNVGSLLYNAGRAIIQGLINGIGDMIDKLTSQIKRITGIVSAFLPGSPVKRGPLRVLNKGYAGKQIVKMLARGIQDETPSLTALMNNTIAPTILGGASPAASSTTVNNNSNTPINIVLQNEATHKGAAKVSAELRTLSLMGVLS
jgi:phage-related protein